MILLPPFATIAVEIPRSMELPEGRGDLSKHRREEEEIDEVGIELRAATVQNDVRGNRGVPAGAIPPGVGDRIVRIGDADNACVQGNLDAPEAAGISGAIPAFVVTEDAFPEVGVESGHGLEHFGAPLGMRGDQLPFARRESMVIVYHIIDRGMDLSDVVKECEALDAAALAVVEVRRARENQRVGSNAADVGSGLVIVGVDSVQKGLESSGREPLGRAPSRRFPGGKERSDCSDRESWKGTKHSIFSWHGAVAGQEPGDRLPERRRCQR